MSRPCTLRASNQVISRRIGRWMGLRALVRTDDAAKSFALTLQRGDPGAGMLRLGVGLRVQGGHAPATFEPEGQVHRPGCVAAGLVRCRVRRLTPRWRAMFLRGSTWSASR